jgi:gliding motility-associated-like protein
MNLRFTRLILLAVFILSGIAANAQLKINEYSASNISTIADNFSEYEDWIELYNPGSSAVNLTGFYLSDSKNNPTKWQFPSGTINPGGYLLIFASGKNQVSGGYIHTDFKLTQTKPEAIVLANASGAIVDSITMKPAQTNHSRGRTTDGASTWSVFLSPTPGAANANAFQEYAARPVMSIAPGFYTGTQTVSITSSSPGTTIYYTTNGNVPTTSSTVYSAPVSVSATQVLRAVAVSSTPGVPPSFIESNSYFINSSHTIDVISIFGDQVPTLLNGNQIDAVTGMEYFDQNGQFKTETIGSTNEHGNDSWAYNQRGIDFICKDQYGYNYALKHQIFPQKSRDKFQRVILKAAANDNYPFASGAHVRDAYVNELSQRGKLSLDERTTRFCIMYVNGQYWGVYDIREKVDDADFTEYYYDQPEDDVQFLKTWGSTWSEYGGAQAQTDWNNLRSYISANSMAVQANYDYVDSVYNVGSLVDYFALNSYTVCSDWLNWNTAWWRGLDPNGDKKKWRYTLWDMDATFGHYVNYTGIPDQSPNADPCNVETLPDPGGQGHTEILNALMANPGFKQFYISRYIDLSNTVFSCTNMQNVLDSMIAVIQPEMQGQVNKWGGTVSGWQGNVQTMKTFIDARCVAMQQGMVDCYSLSGPYNLTFDVQPPGAGQIKVNSITVPSYPWQGTYYGGIDIFLKANANSSYVFDYWEIGPGSTITPSTSDTNTTLTVTASDTIIAHFRRPEDPPSGEVLYVPNAFSPNGDGQNDILYVIGGNLESMELVIYNRWGQVVFQSATRSQGWDGTFNGKALNTDVFAYRLKGRTYDQEEVLLTGNITLIK